MIFICGLNNQASQNLTALLFEAGLPKLEEKRQQELEELLSKIESAEDFSLTSADRRIAVEPGKIIEKQVRNWIRRTKPESLQAWADPRNIWLLEFWARLLPDARFVLHFMAPELDLAEFLSRDERHAYRSESFAKQWQAAHSLMKEFYEQNQQRCMLLETREALRQLKNPTKLRSWMLESGSAFRELENLENLPVSGNRNLEAWGPSSSNNLPVVQGMIAGGLLINNLDVHELYAELVSQQALKHQIPFDPNQRHTDWVAENFEDLHQADLRAEELSQEKRELLESVKTLEANHTETSEQFENLRRESEQKENEGKTRITALEEEKTTLEQKQRELLESVKTLEANHTETSEQFENLRRESEQKENEGKTRTTALEEEKTTLEQQVNSEKEENELLLLQLHQVQEELEHYFLEYKKLQEPEQPKPIPKQNKAGTSSSFRKRIRDKIRTRREVRFLKKKSAVDGPFYLEQNPDVEASKLSAEEHYVRFGWKEGRQPHPEFDGERYLQLNPDVRAAGLNPLLHWLLHGQEEGRTGGMS